MVHCGRGFSPAIRGGRGRRQAGRLTYMAAEGAAGGRGGRAARYPPLSALVISAIAASSAVVVLAVVHSVRTPHLPKILFPRCRVVAADAAVPVTGGRPGCVCVCGLFVSFCPLCVRRRTTTRCRGRGRCWATTWSRRHGTRSRTPRAGRRRAPRCGARRPSPASHRSRIHLGRPTRRRRRRRRRVNSGVSARPTSRRSTGTWRRGAGRGEA